jgi:hypothetical protein
MPRSQGVLVAARCGSTASVAALPPYEQQVAALIARLAEGSPTARAGAAEGLGFLRAEAAQGDLMAALRDSDDTVRRQAAMALGWCGRRESVPPLLAAMREDAWLVRQAAFISLTNLTGLEFPFDAMAPADTRAAQVAAWEAWWTSAPPDQPPPEVLQLLNRARAAGVWPAGPDIDHLQGPARGAGRRRDGTELLADQERALSAMVHGRSGQSPDRRFRGRPPVRPGIRDDRL